MSKSTPAAPDYRAAAEETAAGNKEMLDLQTQANRPNQYTPFGQTEWAKDEGGNWTQTTGLNDQSQRALDAQLGLSADKSELAAGMYGRMEDEFGQPMNWEGLPEIGGAAGARDRAEENLYGRATSRLDPQWEQRTDQTEAKLVAQGLRPGDKAYDQAMENMGRERTDAYDRATSSSIMGGGSEGERTFNMESKDRNRALTEEMQKRGMSLNEINAIISGQQVGMPGMPDFKSAGTTGGANMTGAANSQYGADMDAFNADQAWINSAMQGAGMGASAFMMSDRRLKKHIKQIGTYLGYPWYVWQYVWGEWQCGVMADEVNSEAVFTAPSGYKAVDMTRIK